LFLLNRGYTKGWTIGVSIAGREEKFFPSPKYHNLYCDSPSVHFGGLRGSSPWVGWGEWGLRDRSVKVFNHQTSITEKGVQLHIHTPNISLRLGQKQQPLLVRKCLFEKSHYNILLYIKFKIPSVSKFLLQRIIILIFMSYSNFFLAQNT
jgi:hypothetical protein